MKEIIDRMKREPTELKNILSSYSLDKGLMLRIYKEL
jgi:hypothetical protein